jgi:hypothetical protein
MAQTGDKRLKVPHFIRFPRVATFQKKRTGGLHRKWDVYIGLMRSQFNGGLANAFIENNNVATTAGLRFRY